MNLANNQQKSGAVGGFAVLCVTTPPSGLDRVEAAPMRGFGGAVNRLVHLAVWFRPETGTSLAALVLGVSSRAR